MVTQYIQRSLCVSACLFLLAQPFSSSRADDPKDIVCKDDVCRVSTTHLPLRVLPRPFSNLYKSQKDSPDEIIKSNLPEFRPLFVRKREGVSFDDPTNPTGWYEVMARVNAPGIGWMRAKDVMEWRNLLIVAYTHPGTKENRRQQLLMFEDLNELKKAVESDKRPEAFKAMLEQIKGGQVPKGVISAEPKRFLDIDQQFYILPVLQFEMLEAFDDDARYLQIAAAVPGKRADPENADTITNPEFIKDIIKEGTLDNGSAPVGVDIVFVMDMTSSMGPHIEQTKAALTDVAKLVSRNAAGSETIRYGLVGYRDDHNKMPSLEFTAKNFTPELIAGEQEFIKLIQSDVRAARSSSRDYAEDVYAGLKLAIEGTKWRENSLRFIILVGDASAHEPGHKYSTTGLGASQVRTMADAVKVHILGIHLKVDRAQGDHAIAVHQYEMVTKNPGNDGSAVVSIRAADEAAYNGAVKEITETLVVAVLKIKKGASPGLAGKSAPVHPPTPGPTSHGSGTDIGKKTAKAVEAALITYLGKEAQPPKDLTIWVMDRDVADPSIPALSVRVMITKADLSNLSRALDQLVTTLAQQTFTQQKFFAALQGIVTQGVSGQNVTLKRGEKLAKTGLLPRWISSLPYKSKILAMTDDMFDQLSPDDRAKLETSLEGKLAYYKDILDASDKWIKLDEKAGALHAVYPLPLNELP